MGFDQPKEPDPSDEDIMVNLNNIVYFITSEPTVCGPVGFRHKNETLSDIIEVTPEGKVKSVNTVTDASDWLG